MAGSGLVGINRVGRTGNGWLGWSDPHLRCFGNAPRAIALRHIVVARLPAQRDADSRKPSPPLQRGNCCDHRVTASQSASGPTNIATLYADEHLRLHRSLQRRGLAAPLASDLVQETFIRLLRSLTEEIRDLRAYLYRVADSAEIDLRRAESRARRVIEPGLAPDEAVPDLSPAVEAAMITREEQTALQHAMEQLPSRPREVLVLHRFEGPRPNGYGPGLTSWIPRVPRTRTPIRGQAGLSPFPPLRSGARPPAGPDWQRPQSRRWPSGSAGNWCRSGCSPTTARASESGR